MSPDEARQQRMCGEKLRHKDRRTARHIRRMTERGSGRRYQVYRCPYCGWWHIGRMFDGSEADKERRVSRWQ